MSVTPLLNDGVSALEVMSLLTVEASVGTCVVALVLWRQLFDDGEVLLEGADRLFLK